MREQSRARQLAAANDKTAEDYLGSPRQAQGGGDAQDDDAHGSKLNNCIYNFITQTKNC